MINSILLISSLSMSFASPLGDLVDGLSEKTLSTSPEGWKEIQSHSLAQLAQEPSEFKAHWEAEPQITRAGFYRFLEPTLVNEKWTPLYIARFQNSETEPHVRYALLDLIQRSGGSYSASLPDLFIVEPDPHARALILDLSRHIDSDIAQHLYALGLPDSSPEVQAAVFRNIPHHPEMVNSEWILEGLKSTEEEVLEMVIRSAGWLKIDDAFIPLQKHLASSDPSIRLKTLRALQRINPDHSSRLESIEVLTSDSDSKVSRAAKQIIEISP